MAVTPNLQLELFSPLGCGWREDAKAGAILDHNMMLIDAAVASGGGAVTAPVPLTTGNYFGVILTSRVPTAAGPNSIKDSPIEIIDETPIGGEVLVAVGGLGSPVDTAPYTRTEMRYGNNCSGQVPTLLVNRDLVLDADSGSSGSGVAMIANVTLRSGAAFPIGETGGFEVNFDTTVPGTVTEYDGFRVHGILNSGGATLGTHIAFLGSTSTVGFALSKGLFISSNYQYALDLNPSVASCLGTAPICHSTQGAGRTAAPTILDGWYTGLGSPEGVITANVGSFYSRRDGGAGTSLYIKEAGAGNTGWAVAGGAVSTNPLLVKTIPQAPNWMYEPFGLPTDAAANNYTGALGFRFTVLQNVTVTKLGRKFLPGNSQNHVVNLWSAAAGGTLLASGTVLVASASDVNSFKWVAVTPVTLVPGVTYTLAADETNGGDTWCSGVDCPVLNGLFGLQTISCYSVVGGTSTYPANENGTGSYDGAGIQFTVGPSYAAGLSVDKAGRMLVGNGTDQDYSGKIAANGGFAILAPVGPNAGAPSSPNQSEFLYRQYPGKSAVQIVGDFGQAALTPVLVLTNSRTSGSVAPVLMLEGGNDTGTYPTRGSQFFHRKDANATAIIDYEAGDIFFYTCPAVNSPATPKLTVTADGRVNILSGVPLQWNADTSISRLASGSLALGNGPQGNATGTLTLAKIILSAFRSPLSADAGTPGEVASDGDYIYVCKASGVWKRAALTGGY